MQRYSELRVWNEAHTLLLDVYRVTRSLPESERYGLSSQLRRAALSVPTNIVEGSKRIGRPDFVRFLNLAEASLAETQYLLIVCRDLGYMTAALTNPLIAAAPRIARMLHRLRSRITFEDIQRSDADPPAQERSGDSRESSALASTGASSSARAAEAASSSARATEEGADVPSDELAVARSSARARKACRARSERRR